MNIGIIIQARLNSERFPKKVLAKLPFSSERTVIENVIERAQKSEIKNVVVVATSDCSSDDELFSYLIEKKYDVFRGSEKNLLERYYLTAKKYDIDVIVRLTGDNPCIDGEIIDFAIKKLMDYGYDYVSTSLSQTFPLGISVEVFTYTTLEKAYLNAKSEWEKEHVTPYIYKTNSQEFKIGILEASKDLKYSNIRVTLDTKEDYTLLCAVYDYLYDKNKYFTTRDIVKLFTEKKWLYDINNNIQQKKVCKNLDEEIEESLKLLDKQDLNRAHKYLKEQYYGK